MACAGQSVVRAELTDRWALPSLHDATLTGNLRPQPDGAASPRRSEASDGVERLLRICTAPPQSLGLEGRSQEVIDEERCSPRGSGPAARDGGQRRTATWHTRPSKRDQMGDASAFVTTDMAFHARIAAILENPILIATSQSLLRWLFHYHGFLLYWSGNEDVTLREDDQIIDLLEVHDDEAAVTAMQAQLGRADTLYRRHH